MKPYEGMLINGPYAKPYGRKYIFYRYPGEKKYRNKMYSRYLMEINLGRYLNKDEEVHHKDGNPFNDSLSNLIVVSKEQHYKKHKKYFPIKTICPSCNNEFILTERQQIERKSRGIICEPSCSVSCATRYRTKKGLSTIK